MKKIIICLAILAAFCSCKKNNTSDSIRSLYTNVEYDLEGRVELPAYFISGAIPDYLDGALRMRCTNIAASPDDAQIIFVHSSCLASNQEVLENAWRNGKTIVEIQPDNQLHSRFWEQVQGPAYLSGEQTGNDLLFMAVRRFSCYQLQNPLIPNLFDRETATKEDVSPESDFDDRKDNTTHDIVSEPIAATASFINTLLASFVNWTKTEPKIADLPVPSFDGDLYKRITDTNFCQHITKTFNVGATNYRICKVTWSDPDVVTRNSTIDLDIYIAPLYSYEKNSLNGDFYFVTTQLVSHNAPLYGLYKEWHGAVRTWAHVFFGRNLDFKYTLLDGNRNNISSNVLSFYETPKPETTATSTTYTTGFSSSLNVSGQGGIAGGKPTGLITVGGTFTWSNSRSVTIPDQRIEMSTEPSSRAVHYNFFCENDQEEDETEKAVPGIARTDQKCEASWCWRVAETKDDNLSQKYVLKVEINPIYRLRWRHATWSCEGDRREENLLAEGLRTFYVDVYPPNRTRNGVFEIKSTNSNYMANLKIYNGTTVVAQSTSAYEKNSTQRYQIPVGKYKVEYEIRNGDTSELMGKYRIAEVEINTAETTSKSSLDGEKYE